MKKRVLIVTDCTDVAACELRAAVTCELDRLGASNIEVDSIAAVREFSIVNADFIVRLLAESHVPEATTLLVIVNPFRTDAPDRARLAGRTRHGLNFVTANTGSIAWLLHDFGISDVREFGNDSLDGEKFVPFGGKVFHAPIAARLAATGKLEEIGLPFDAGKIKIARPELGTVVHIDNFGVAKVFGMLPTLRNGDQLEIRINQTRTCVATFSRAMKNLPDGTWTIYKGSSLDGLPEIARVRCLDSAKQLGITVGDMVSWKKL